MPHDYPGDGHEEAYRQTLIEQRLSKKMNPDEPTPNLRFVIKEGKRILQQLWLLENGGAEWRDVPLVTLTEDTQP